jgi:DNA-binding CsgD family transcriptional regulator
MTTSDLMTAAANAAEAVLSAPSAEAAANAALTIAKGLGYHALGVVERPSGQSPASGAVLYSTAPHEPVSKYRTRSYASADPIVQRTLRGDALRLISGVGEENLSEIERRIFKSHHCGAGFSDGLIIPVRRSVHPAGVILFGGMDPDFSAKAQAALTLVGFCLYGRLEQLKHGTTAEDPRPSALSSRERSALARAAQGMSDAEAGMALGCSPRTVRFHIANAKTKLRASTRAQAVARAIAIGAIKG